MPLIHLSAGPIEYQDTGGDGPVLVLAHGLPMNHTQWRKVLPLLSGYRCLLPTLPLGAHRRPMNPDADLSQLGVARLLGEFIERLDLHDVTLALNDWGGGQFLLSDGKADRIGRLVLVACEAFDNFPPGFAARALGKVARVPGVAWLMFQGLRIPAIRHSRLTYGGMSLRGIPDDVLDDWFAPAQHSRAIRRDFAKFATSSPDRRTLLAWSERLRKFDRPVLVVWARQDSLMPREHGPKLAALYPRGRLVEIDGSATLIPEDQPERLAETMIDFLTDRPHVSPSRADDFP